ncbi:cytidylate kinase [Gracilibacillus boraciitolerans JCM 21714]|uniref:Cytidylate kinase n=1 Tax=Gracilibacillus boraciitolerans JCM 21714 TaxID=1298598 RepID=W4VDQ3_9BACI|nr:(d)CMP kinase [Gracilibacillus boraciitolerans]GAE91347.1 cytidylate kinase [Gracilibacillus boraciitolerans JCM 21714]
MKEKKIAIAIDGPAAAGKSTVAKIVAKKLGYIYIDTGAMYRSLTYSVLHHHIDIQNKEEVVRHLHNLSIDINKEQQVFVNNENVTDAIRSEQVTNNVSIIASIADVRKEMVQRQQKLANKRAVVMDGRDIGTHVIPDAEIKVFLIASVSERAKRRHEENTQKGFPSNLHQIKNEIEKRDKMDSEREVSPLKKAEDAIEIDTTHLSIDQVAEKILDLAISN